ncbi:pyridoxal 5'-phosphate synthase glutaminase subunit PdxT [Streptococcus caballi]|uniref:pyridoxal 5'-phosphate synthase glutaminase subunit PdxT n=1 Tax=Streptococcus caballi TaxID=439220 RepID=UPI0003688994|nr:pyridoxal 5'-phosphate synthase glutaminase subunit PdxT [Streptococcus caballi]
MISIGILALQGAFAEHAQKLNRLGVDPFYIRQLSDLDNEYHGLILPGGESTVQGKLLKDLHLFNPLKSKIEAGLPVLGTCAGLILLAEKLVEDETVHFGTLPVTVQRNAYGRQLGSFERQAHMAHLGEVPMTFIRAPYVSAIGKGVDILAQVDGRVVAVQYQNQLGLAFHPELTDSDVVHDYFIELCHQYKDKAS